MRSSPVSAFPIPADDEGSESDASEDQQASPAPPAGRKRRSSRSSADASGAGDGMVPDAMAWLQTLLAPAVLQAAVLTAAVVLGVLLTPLDAFVLKYAPVLEGLPHAGDIIKAVLAGIALTILRPPVAV